MPADSAAARVLVSEGALRELEEGLQSVARALEVAPSVAPDWYGLPSSHSTLREGLQEELQAIRDTAAAALDRAHTCPEAQWELTRDELRDVIAQQVGRLADWFEVIHGVVEALEDVELHGLADTVRNLEYDLFYLRAPVSTQATPRR